MPLGCLVPFQHILLIALNILLIDLLISCMFMNDVIAYRFAKDANTLLYIMYALIPHFVVMCFCAILLCMNQDSLEV